MCVLNVLKIYGTYVGMDVRTHAFYYRLFALRYLTELTSEYST